MTWRRSETISWITMILVIVGHLWIAATRAKTWDVADEIVNDKVYGNVALDKRMAISETRNIQMADDIKWIRDHIKP